MEALLPRRSTSSVVIALAVMLVFNLCQMVKLSSNYSPCPSTPCAHACCSFDSVAYALRNKRVRAHVFHPYVVFLSTAIIYALMDDVGTHSAHAYFSLDKRMVYILVISAFEHVSSMLALPSLSIVVVKFSWRILTHGVHKYSYFDKFSVCLCTESAFHFVSFIYIVFYSVVIYRLANGGLVLH